MSRSGSGQFGCNLFDKLWEALNKSELGSFYREAVQITFTLDQSFL